MNYAPENHQACHACIEVQQQGYTHCVYHAHNMTDKLMELNQPAQTQPTPQPVKPDKISVELGFLFWLRLIVCIAIGTAIGVQFIYLEFYP